MLDSRIVGIRRSYPILHGIELHQPPCRGLEDPDLLVLRQIDDLPQLLPGVLSGMMLPVFHVLNVDDGCAARDDFPRLVRTSFCALMNAMVPLL